jgi:N-methylhydantoinase B/oxoprolinase/acetone carboxylase alpha subunit
MQTVASLSGGQLLRAGLACVLGGASPPPLLVLDEPTNHLDIASIEAVEAGYVGLKSGAKMRGKGFQTVPPDDRLVVMTPGGAGIGEPRERARDRVREDVESGLVSPDNAAALYGLPR